MSELSLLIEDERGPWPEAIELHLPFYPDLSESEIAELMAAVQRRHPEAKEFREKSAFQTGPGEPRRGRSLLERRHASRIPTAAQVDQYQKEYQAWLGRVRKQFEQLGHTLNVRNRIQKLRIVLANTSFRPAGELLLELTLSGSASLSAALGDKTPKLIEQVMQLPPPAILPQPPPSPRARNWLEVMARNARRNFPDRSDLALALSLYATNYTTIGAAFPDRGRHQFYRCDNDETATSASFACEEFRHERAPFNIWLVVPARLETVQTRLHVHVSARNVVMPVDRHLQVSIRPDRKSTYEVATQWQVDSSA